MAAAPFFLSLFLLAPIVRTHTKGRKKEERGRLPFSPPLSFFPQMFRATFQTLCSRKRRPFFPSNQCWVASSFAHAQGKERPGPISRCPKSDTCPGTAPKSASPSVKFSPPPPFCLARAKQHFLTCRGAVEINDGKRKTKKKNAKEVPHFLGWKREVCRPPFLPHKCVKTSTKTWFLGSVERRAYIRSLLGIARFSIVILLWDEGS